MKKLFFGLFIFIASITMAQMTGIPRTDPAIKYFVPLDTMVGAGYFGKGCTLTYTVTYGLADTVFTTITIPGDTTSYCTIFAVRHPDWTSSLLN